MAADSESYIHPIIAAMIASADSKDRALALDQKKKTDQDESDFRKQQLAEVVKRAEQEHQINMGHLQLASDAHNLAVKQFIHQAQHGVLSDIASRVQPVAALPSAPTIPTSLNSQPGDPSQTATPSPASVQPTPNFSQIPAAGPSDSQDGNVDVGGISMPRAAVAGIPAAVAAQKGAVETAVATAKDNAATPNQDKKDKDAYDRAVTLSNMQTTRAQALADQAQTRAESVARIRANSEHDRGEMALVARMLAINGGMGTDPDIAANKYNGIINGQTQYSSLSKGEKAAVDKVAAARGTTLPTNQAAYSKKLDQMGGIQDLIGQYRDLATNYSKDSPNANIIQKIPGLNMTGLNSTNIPGTDLKSKSDALKAQGGQLASYFDQQNRKSDAEILRQFGGLFDPKATTTQNLDKIEQHLKTLRTSVKGNFAGMNSQDIENVLSQRGAHDLLESMNPAGQKPLTSATAHQLLVESHGDNAAALKLATARGYDTSKIVQ